MSAVQTVGALGGASAGAFLAAVERRLERTVRFGRGATARASAETRAAGGKRLRPLLVHLSAAPGGHARHRVERAACAVELVHMATLVHDDLLDAAPLRRGRRTVWAAHGPTVAAATGDYLFARAFAELAGTHDPLAVRTLSDAALDLARGEALQAEQARQPETPVDAYLERCRLKTGRLFGAACALGARLSGLDEADQERLGRFGVALGLAFQVADDALDCDGDPSATGKALGTDLMDGTVTLPLLLAAGRDPLVAGALRDGVEREAIRGVLHRVVACGAVAEARSLALDFARQAELELDGVSGRCAVDALRGLLHRAVERDA